MIDIIGAISLTGLCGLFSATLITAIPVDAAARRRLAAAAVLWFACISSLGALGIFSATSIGTPAIGAAVIAPIALLLFAAARSSSVRSVALHTPLVTMVALHAGRILGVFFLLLLSAGRLPPTFALAAGWGDIGIAVAALPLAWAIQHQVSGWRTMTFAWNVLGFADLVTAVTLGVGSAPNSPVRFIFETSNSGAIAFLPWVIIPGVLVPLYLLTHIAIFAQLVKAFAGKRHHGHGGRVAWESSAR
jgi:hypothetical protein